MSAFTRLATPGVQRLTPYVPGKPLEELEREFGIRDAVKLASNENPLGPSPRALDVLREHLGALHRYPEGSAHALKQALAVRLEVSADCLTIGNGSNDILCLLAQAFLGPGTSAVYAQYAFLVYALAVQAAGAEARVAPARPAGGPQPLGHDLATLQAAITPTTRLVFIANPNNPTGTWLGADELLAFLAAVPPDVIVVLDEAYADYSVEGLPTDTVGWLARFPNLVLCRTFSKLHALAGLRVGYGVSHPQIAELLNRCRQPFNVNTLGQAAALAALDDEAHVRASIANNRAGLAQLASGLEAFGWRVPPSAGNFVLATVGPDAARWNQALLRAGVIVRPVDGYGLPEQLRITVGLPAENRRLLDTLARIRAQGLPG